MDWSEGIQEARKLNRIDAEAIVKAWGARGPAGGGEKWPP